MFIEKLAAQPERTLCRKCVPKLFDDLVSLDETTDVKQRCCLFATKVLEATNSNIIAAFLDECVNELIFSRTQ